MKSALVFPGGLSGYQLGAAQGMGLSGWGRRTQHLDKVSCGWGMGADRVVQAQNLYGLAQIVVQLVSQGLSGGMGVETGGRCERGRMFETGKKVLVEGRGSGEVWAGAVPGTETLLDRVAG